MNKVLVKARKEKGLTITQAASQIGISHAMLAMLETRKRQGSDSTKIKVARFYGSTVGDLFFIY